MRCAWEEADKSDAGLCRSCVQTQHINVEKALIDEMGYWIKRQALNAERQDCVKFMAWRFSSTDFAVWLSNTDSHPFAGSAFQRIQLCRICFSKGSFTLNIASILPFSFSESNIQQQIVYFSLRKSAIFAALFLVSSSISMQAV
jgi:hypothetical protein